LSLILLCSCAAIVPTHQGNVRTAPLGDATISFTVQPGRGNALLLLHGWASDSSIWDLVTPLVRGAGPLIAVDAPGHGGSTRGSAAFTYRLYAEAAHRALATQGGGSAVLIAHSNGGYVAREYWRAFPNDTCAIVLIDGSLRPAFQNPDAMRDRLAAMTEDAWGPLLASMDAPPQASVETLRRLPGMHRRADFSAAMEASRALLDNDLYGDDTIGAPVLLIIGPNPIWTDEHLRWMASVAPQLRIERVRHGSHWLTWDAPNEVAELVGNFVTPLRC
jgi:pimeloyl-ACP methyl ester carboxylesterase